MQQSEMEQPQIKQLEAQASLLAEAMPELMIKAQKVAHTVAHGVHGRRRAGPGETFWQFRQYQTSDPINQIDWRRSASSDTLYVREREWEAAHTMWLWPDMSSSMQFQSNLADIKKQDTALVIALALCELLIKAGERVGLLGLSPPIAAYNAAQRLGEILVDAVRHNRAPAHLPDANVRVSALSECVILSDCLEPVDIFIQHCRNIATQNVRGHVVHILDPVEETFPYQGRIEFQNWAADTKVLFHRAQNVREEYKLRLDQHKAELKSALEAMKWTYKIHRTDSSASSLLLSLYTQISGADSAPMSFKAEPALNQSGEQL